MKMLLDIISDPRIYVPFFIMIVAAVTLWVRRRIRHIQRQRMFGKARKLEGEAVEVLRRYGFEATHDQVVRECFVEVDGEPVSYKVKADYLVKDRLGRILVAEVKSGSKAPSPTYSATRRQLLEYQIAYPEAVCVLLVDMTERSVKTIRFSIKA